MPAERRPVVIVLHYTEQESVQRSLDTLRTAAGRACALLRVLAHDDRLILLCQLAQGEHSVGELETRLGIAQPTLSQQLGVLRREGLVSTRRDGKHIHYRIASDDALALIDQAERDRAIRLLQDAGLPVVPPQEMTPAHFMEHMAVDKKVLDGRLRLVLLRQMGEAVITDDYPKEILQATLSADYRAIVAQL